VKERKMSPKMYRKSQPTEDIEQRDDQERSRIVHRIGPVSTGLFPGWGPKL
jgi:hypothetical protein